MVLVACQVSPRRYSSFSRRLDRICNILPLLTPHGIYGTRYPCASFPTLTSPNKLKGAEKAPATPQGSFQGLSPRLRQVLSVNPHDNLSDFFFQPNHDHITLILRAVPFIQALHYKKPLLSLVPTPLRVIHYLTLPNLLTNAGMSTLSKHIYTLNIVLCHLGILG